MTIDISLTKGDAYEALQAAIDASVNGGDVFIPAGVYTFSKPLVIGKLVNNKWQQVRIRIHGESSYWGSGGTVLKYTGNDSFALAVQLGKGVEIDHLTIQGGYIAPIVDSDYYKHTDATYFNPLNKCHATGIVIDYDVSRGKSGSTGVYVHDVQIRNFETMVAISPAHTQNADILTFERIQFADGKYGFVNGQPQEKGNTIRSIYSWGKMYCLFLNGVKGSAGSGNWVIDGGNIAGSCVQLFDIDQGGWYPTSISNLFCEGFGRIGKLWSHLGMPLTLTNNVFHPVPSSYELLINLRGENVSGSANIIRYYEDDLLRPLKVKSYDGVCRIGGKIAPILFVK